MANFGEFLEKNKYLMNILYLKYLKLGAKNELSPESVSRPVNHSMVSTEFFQSTPGKHFFSSPSSSKNKLFVGNSEKLPQYVNFGYNGSILIG